MQTSQEEKRNKPKRKLYTSKRYRDTLMSYNGIALGENTKKQELMQRI